MDLLPYKTKSQLEIFREQVRLKLLWSTGCAFAAGLTVILEGAAVVLHWIRVLTRQGAMAHALS